MPRIPLTAELSRLEPLEGLSIATEVDRRGKALTVPSRIALRCRVRRKHGASTEDTVTSPPNLAKASRCPLEVIRLFVKAPRAELGDSVASTDDDVDVDQASGPEGFPGLEHARQELAVNRASAETQGERYQGERHAMKAIHGIVPQGRSGSEKWKSSLTSSLLAVVNSGRSSKDDPANVLESSAVVLSISLALFHRRTSKTDGKREDECCEQFVKLN